MEAMKMENILRAAKAATVKATPVKAGDKRRGRSGHRGV